MPPHREPLFLARQSYRRRRLEDAARLLPLLGAFLFLLTLFAGNASEASRATYVFISWIFLIVSAALLSRHLNRRKGSASGDSDVAHTAQDHDAAPRGDG